MNDRIRTRLVDVLEAATAINGWTKTYSFENVLDDLMVESAFILQFERIGEALRVVREIDPDFESEIPEINGWIGLRHRLVHDYREIDLGLLWSSSVEEIPVLINLVRNLLNDE